MASKLHNNITNSVHLRCANRNLWYDLSVVSIQSMSLRFVQPDEHIYTSLISFFAIEVNVTRQWTTKTKSYIASFHVCAPPHDVDGRLNMCVETFLQQC